ncbi:hypothetical protein BJ138DRAFT_1185969 [Hygrophoropsis aurantiaca]|uniref:Uncharacterized protein n=1 Tax=Hygrophoropsis aurantiaca TaxID=72124 RepID=A0ACB8ADM7_9AGAM|nr:hypothetical protein BJ138DRAFT_1185969 [Hygrophoropsis aurantiaca]
MHPRNPYRNPPDFASLAEQYYPLKKHIISTHDGGSTVDFQDPAAQRRLTEALLWRDFALQLSVPDNRLCPPVPNRLNYVLWLQDIVAATFCSNDAVRGIDIGTGASAIYPLLACRLNPSWIIHATDIDDLSLHYARANVDRNNLQNRITVGQTKLNDPIFSIFDVDIDSQYDFTMCNPPFYNSAEDVARSAETKDYSPSAVCTGAEVEMITPGGEYSFVERMVKESLQHKTRCRWFTSMLGKMSSVPEIVALLRLNKIDNYAITEFVQGQTRRWAIAWSFSADRLPDMLARINNPMIQSSMPPRNNLQQAFSSTHSVDDLIQFLRHNLGLIDGVRIISVETDLGSSIFAVETLSNSWSRAARRKKLAPEETQESLASIAPVLRCRIECSQGDSSTPGPRDSERKPSLKFQYVWVSGHDRTIFESFVSHVNRKVGQQIQEMQ